MFVNHLGNFLKVFENGRKLKIELDFLFNELKNTRKGELKLPNTNKMASKPFPLPSWLGKSLQNGEK